MTITSVYLKQRGTLELEVYKDGEDWCYELRDSNKPNAVIDCSALGTYQEAREQGEASLQEQLAA